MTTAAISDPGGEAAALSAKIDVNDTYQSALDIIRRDSLYAMGVGIIPVPFLDLVGVTGVQINMLRKLSNLYGAPFSANRAKSLIAALLGGAGSIAGAGLVASLIKAIPVLGQTAGALAMPVTAGAATYALGRVFIQHFASGGTFLDFQPVKVREHFQKEFEAAKSTVKDLKAGDLKGSDLKAGVKV